MSEQRGILARPAPSGGGPVLPQLDALRGVAILAVFAQHLGDRFLPVVEASVDRATPRALAPWILTIAHHAWWGVDLFFVLSGFSLALGYLRGFAKARAAGRAGESSLGAISFYRRRAARILPGYFAAIAVVIAVRPGVVRMPGFGAAIAAHLAVLQGYVVPGGIVLIGAAWSLTTEIHFYLLLPILARPLLDRDPRSPWRRYVVAAAICLGAWISRAILHAIVLDPGVRSGLLEATQRRWISSRLDQFVLGAVAAAIWVEITASPEARARAAKLAPIGALASIAALIVAFRLEGALYLSPGGSWPYALMSIATAAIVLAAVLAEGRAIAVIAPRPLRAIGIISYGVFLYHQLAIGVIGHLVGGEGWGSLAANGALSLALACGMGVVSWGVIERPALAWEAARRRGQ